MAGLFDLPRKRGFNTSSNINDSQNTKVTAYYKILDNGYIGFFAEATKNYKEGPIEFISSEQTIAGEPTNEDVKQIVAGKFFEVANQIYSADEAQGVWNKSSQPEVYQPADFILDPPKRVPWQQPIPGPEEKEKERLSLKEKRDQAKKDAQDKMPNFEEIKNATPKDLLAKGKEALPSILYALGYTILQTQVIPALEKLVREYIEKFIEDGVQSCPPELQELIRIRDKIVDQLNKLAKKIEKIGTTISGSSTFLSATLIAIKSIDFASIGISLALKAFPAAPVPGGITSALNDAQTFIRKQTFDKLGNSKLATTTSTVLASALVLSLVGGWISQALDILARLDVLIMNCNPNSTLTPISDEVKSISLLYKEAQNTQNSATYQGFILDVETIPYTPTVNRTQAVGKNSQGIVLIRGELSFTSNNQTLINELKLIIDRDNLQAY